MPANTRFNIFTGLLKAYVGDQGERRFRTTASSTITDLAGDEILPPAIEKMAEKAKGNLTIFLNHEYRVPEDVLGSVESTSMQTRGVDAGGNPIVDLDFDIRLNESNPRALQTYEAIKAGVRLGTSIGAIVRHAEKKKGGGLRIDDLDLLEASIVGIPANPRSWVQYAVKSLSKTEIEEEAVIEDEKIAEAEPMVVGEDGPEIVVLAGTCPTCGKGRGAGGDCSNGFHKSTEPETEKDQTPEVTEAEPDKEASRTRVTVTVDSNDAQDAPKSQPEAALMDEDRADTTEEPDNESLGDTITHDVEPDKTADAAGLTSDDAADLAAIVKNFSEIVTKYNDLQKKYDALVAKAAEADENLVVARQIIDRIADLPIGQKTAFKGAVDDFRTRFPQYDNEFHKFLEK